MCSASAPISKDVYDFIRVVFSAEMREGYGMTETSGGSCTTFFGDPNSGHVGGPVANCKIKLKDIPELGYLSTNIPPSGEVCLFGSSVMTGYFKNEEKTNECIQNGWLMSGDVGRINDDMSLTIIDRAKNIFKLS